MLNAGEAMSAVVFSHGGPSVLLFPGFRPTGIAELAFLRLFRGLGRYR